MLLISRTSIYEKSSSGCVPPELRVFLIRLTCASERLEREVQAQVDALHPECTFIEE